MTNQSPGQIAGHVFRADSGEPLPGVFITLSPAGGTEGRDASQRTAVDGGFIFTGVSPGAYFLLAYRTGFVGRFYGQKEEAGLMCPPSCVSVSTGEKVDGTNLRLTPYPPISSMKDDALDAAYSSERIHMGFDPARFSPDGKHFAFAVAGITTGIDPLQVWIYDLDSRNLRRMPREETNLHLSIRDLAWGQDNTLYISAQIKSGPERPVFLASTSSGTRVISAIPEGVGEESHPRFFVSSERLCRGCAFTLTARRSDGSGEYEIAEIDRDFIFDADHSMVLYPKLGPIVPGSIVLFDLNTRQSREIPLPVAAQALLDQVHVGASQLIAYLTVGSCAPDASSEEAASQTMLPHNVSLRRQIMTRRVCFVRLP